MSGRRSLAAGSRSSTAQAAPKPLPPNEPLTHRLTEDTRRELYGLYHAHKQKSAKVDTHVKAAIVAVIEMAGDVNEHLSKRRQKAKKAREKRDAEVLPSEDEAMRETEERVREMTNE